MSETQDVAAKSPWINHFHFIIPNATAAAILMLPSPQGWQLPYVRGEGLFLADTAQLIPLLRESLPLNFPFTILRYIALDESQEERWDRILFVLEPAQPLHHEPLNGQWSDSPALQALPLAHPESRAPLLDYLAEHEEVNEEGDHAPRVDLPRIDPRRAPWARRGWFANASAWIEEAVAESGYTQTGAVEQFRNWSISSLLTVPTSAGRLFFKAAAALPLFVNEPALLQTLAALYPNHLPEPLKIDREKRWVLMEDFGTTARAGESVDYAAVFAAYGKLQRESARHLDKLFAAGCIDRRLDVLANQIDPLIHDPITRAALSEEEHNKLVALAPQLKARCAEVAAFNLPAALLHGDLHMGNVTQRNGEFIFFDWTDAAVGFPFADHFLLYFELDEEEDGATRCRDAYLAAWLEDESPARLLEAWQLAKPLCALHHSVSYLSILNNIEPLARTELFHGLPDNLRRVLASFNA